MRKIKNIISSAFVAIAIGCSSMMTSCTDYLTLYPTNAVILENYWKTAEDVNSMVATCYSSLANSDIITRMMIWGELRSDNLVTRTGASNDLKYIVEANLLETNGYFKWEHFYKTINYCNLVLQYAPGVMEEDPDFTQGDFDVIKGEMYALRALCHFYLVRSFRDIPMGLVAMDSDDQDRNYPQYSPYEALDIIMADLDSATKYCMKTGGWSESRKNYARITKDAVYAMKADVNMWRAAFAQYNILSNDTAKYISTGEPIKYTAADVENYYTQAIENCDSVLVSMKRQVLEEYDERKLPFTVLDTLTNPYLLIPIRSKEYYSPYDEIFLDVSMMSNDYMTPNEVIFKLDFSSTNKNSAIQNMYGYNESNGQFVVPAAAPVGLEADGLWQKSDMRFNAFTNFKYAKSSGGSDSKKIISITKYNVKTAAIGKDGIEWYGNGNNISDWIFYRKTDVMLMKATALAYRYHEGDHSEAYALVNAVNKRSVTTVSQQLAEKDYEDQSALKSLVLDERLRELSFEGKRWYDLVRMALCDGSTDKVIELVKPKFDSGGNAASIKMSSIHSLFCPIYETELKLNPLLKQNPVFERSSSTEQN
ncbi:MAG: RagB/SusD family nutrient uptake outer membrane protein [Bacteroidaceae bacterium]|nr:RagB/SusD family nutrient uptake outer membrane protein [Bacteroidaceae bacterium]